VVWYIPAFIATSGSCTSDVHQTIHMFVHVRPCRLQCDMCTGIAFSATFSLLFRLSLSLRELVSSPSVPGTGASSWSKVWTKPVIP